MFRRKSYRRRISRDQIGAPVEFMHVDGESFTSMRVIDLEQARYDLLVERLKTVGPADASIVTRQHARVERPPYLLTSHRCTRPRATKPRVSVEDLRPEAISEPFGFVHVQHVSLKDLTRPHDDDEVPLAATAALSATESPASDNESSLDGNHSVVEHSEEDSA